MDAETAVRIGEDMKKIRKSCPLCRLYHFGDVKSEVYHRDMLCIVVECVSSHTPMVVARFHGRQPTKGELNHMVNLALNLGKRLGWKWGYLDFRNHVCPAHWHMHVR